MSVEQRVMSAVARVDLFLCSALRWLAVVLPLTVVLVLAVIAARHFARAQPGMIDYDRPGVDITSEGPEAFTDQWTKWR